MAFKYSKGERKFGDIKAEGDAQGDTLIDFEEDQIDFQTSGSVRLRIENDTITTTIPVHISGSEIEGLRIAKGGADYRAIVFETDGVDTANISLSNAENLVIQNETNGKDIQFWVNPSSDSNTQAMTIKQDVKIGINNTNPSTTLDVGGDTTISGTLTIGEITFPTTDGNSNQVLTTDGLGNLTFQTQATGSGANPPGGSDRQVQFNDNGSFAGNYGILVDTNFNLKVSGSLISAEGIGVGTDLGGGRNASDEWVSITGPEHKFHVVGDVTDSATFSIDQASDTVGGAYWTFSKARGTPSSSTGVNTNDEIARIQFFAHTGSSTLKRSALILAQADSDGDGRLRFYVTKEGDIDNVAIECYNNQVTVQDQLVIGSAGIIPITDGGASLGGADYRFENIQGNNLKAFESLQLGGTHPIYDQTGFGISINKDHLPIGNYTSGEGLAYISNSSAIENVILALQKTGSHFGGMALNGTVTDNDQKIVFFSQYNTAGFEWKNNIPSYGTNGMGNLTTTGTTLMELGSDGALSLGAGLTIDGDMSHNNYSKSLYPSNLNNTGSYALQKSFVKEFMYTKYQWPDASATDLFTIEPYDERTGSPYSGTNIWAGVGVEITVVGHYKGVGQGNVFSKIMALMHWSSGARSTMITSNVTAGQSVTSWFSTSNTGTLGQKLSLTYNSGVWSGGPAMVHIKIYTAYAGDDESINDDGKHIYWVLTENFSGGAE